MCSPEPGKANIVRENTNGPFVGHGSPVKELDERENDDGLTNQVQGFIGSMKVGPIAKQEVATEGKGASSSSKWLQNGGLDELEPIELTGPVSNVASALTSVAPRKPIIRLNFTSLPKATGSSA